MSRSIAVSSEDPQLVVDDLSSATKSQLRGRYYMQRAVRASFWSLLMRVALRGTGVVRNVVLARILAPDDFGLFGIALVVLSIIDRFSDAGLQSALIQKDRDIAGYLDNVWTVQALRGAAAALALVLGGPWMAEFFNEPRATPLIQVLGLSIFIRGLVNPGVLYFRRELEVNRQFVLRFGGTVVDLLVSIVAAVVLRSAWALMIGLIAGLLTRLIVSYVIHPFRPRPRFHFEQTRELGRYGRWVFLNNILNFLAYKGDNLLVGKLIGSTALGVYMLAYTISEVVTVEISRILTDVAFPAYSRVQSDLARVRKAFSTLLEVIWAVVLPITVVMWSLAEPLTMLLLGPKWIQVGDLLPYLAVAGGARVLIANTAVVFKGLGQPEVAFRQNLLSVALIYALMYPLGVRLGLEGVAIAVMLGLVGSALYVVVRLQSVLAIRLHEMVRVLLPGFVLGAVVLATIKASQLMVQLSLLPQFSISVGAVGVAYLTGCFVLWKAAGAGPLRLLPLLHRARPKDIDTADGLVQSA